MAGHGIQPANSLAWTLVPLVAGARSRAPAWRAGRGAGGRLPTSTMLRAHLTPRGFRKAIRSIAVPLLGRQALANERNRADRRIPCPGRSLSSFPGSCTGIAVCGTSRTTLPRNGSCRRMPLASALQLRPFSVAAGLRRPGVRFDRGDPVPRRVGAARPAAFAPGAVVRRFAGLTAAVRAATAADVARARGLTQPNA